MTGRPATPHDLRALLSVAAAIVAALVLRRAERPSAGLPVEHVEPPEFVTTDAA